MSFERNFYKASAVCPKCGLGNPEPKYVPRDTTTYFLAYEMYCRCVSDIVFFSGTKEDFKAPPESLITPDRVDCLCRCGHQWSEKP